MLSRSMLFDYITYIIKTKNHGILNFTLETKDTKSADNLRKQEDGKIQHAMKMFEKLGQTVNIKFETEFKHQQIKELLSKSYKLI